MADEPKIGKNRGNAGKGRPRGALNKATADIKALAQEHGPRAILALAEMMADEEQPGKTRVSAANALLDRGYGKAAITANVSGDLSEDLRAWLGLTS